MIDLGLIPLQHFQAFLDHAWPRFLSSPYRDAIKGAAYTIVPARRETVETRFLSLFATLEEIVLVFRREHQREFVLDAARRNPMQEHLKAAVRSFEPPLTPEERGQMYETLKGAARVPLRRAFEELVTLHKIEVSDLWPVFGENSLNVIRNRIAHGDLDAETVLGSLAVATEHLRWLVERCVLALLEWDVNTTEVRPALLARVATAMIHLKDARADLEKALGQPRQ